MVLPSMWQGDLQMDVDPWLVQIIPPMELALAFQFTAEVQLAARANLLFSALIQALLSKNC